MRGIFVFVLLLWCELLNATPVVIESNNHVVFSGLNNIYLTGEKVEFSVKNNTAKMYLFYVVPERLIGDGWREIDYSISEKPSKSVRFNQLKGYGVSFSSWNPWRQRVTQQLGSGMYRLKIKLYDETGKEYLNAVISDSFELTGKSEAMK